jgi:hypothetical protein
MSSDIPYNCDTWTEGFESSNIQALGTKDSFLVVRFCGGGSYRYPGSAFLLSKLMQSKSKGKAFAVYVKNRSCERLCQNGCWEPVCKVAREAKMDLCESCWQKRYAKDIQN